MITKSSLGYRGMELLVSYHQNHSIQVRNQLVQLNAGLVRKIAHRVSHRCAEPYEDLEQIGYLGLIRAIERFDPSLGSAFSSFAVPYIRGAMLHFLRDKSSMVKIPRRLRDLQKKAEKVQEALVASLGHPPKESEIVEVLQVSVAEWQDSKLAAQTSCRVLSLDIIVGQHLDSPMTLGDMLIDSSYQRLQDWEEERQQLETALSQLEGKTRRAIEYVFFQDMPRKEVAVNMGVSSMTVTRYIQRGIAQLVSILNPPAAGVEV